MKIYNKLFDVYFFTATILNWQIAIDKDNRKQFILDALVYLVKTKRIRVFGFVIMPNHIHILWHSQIMNIPKMKLLTQGSLLKYTSKNILNDMNEVEKKSYFVQAKDRKYQIWERNPLWVECFYVQIAEQILKYIHNNPCQVKWSLAEYPADYQYSSADYYENGNDRFGFLTNLNEW